MLDYILGLDIGISSIGWAVLATDSHGEPVKIEDLGVRIFEKAEQPKTGASLALPRREARSMRRRVRRRRHRKERIRALLIHEGAMTEAAMTSLFQNSSFEKDVYTLRAEGLDRLLTPDEWTRVLIHLSQRRGYRSNSTAEAAKDKDTGVLKIALSENKTLLEQKHYRTVGEMFCKDKKFTQVDPDGTIWRKTRNDPGEYRFTVTRDMIEQEARDLFDAQRSFGNPYASESLATSYLNILLSQRNFDEGPGGNSPYQNNDLRGTCTFEPTELRAFKACYTFEYFKLLQDINHIKLLENGQSRSLTADEREHIIHLAMKSDSLTYARLRKELSLGEDIRFNTVRYTEAGMEESEKKSKFPEMQSYHKIRKALDKISKNYIATLSHEQLDEIATVLSLYKADDKRTAALKAVGIDESAIAALLPLSFSKAGHLSLTAMKKLTPYLEAGSTYDKACTAVYGDHRAHFSSSKTPLLSFNEMRNDGTLDTITNPVVLRAISQTCKVVNAIIRRYGAPLQIHVELAREMSRNFEDRMKMDKEYKENHAANQRLIEQIEEIKGGRATGQDIVKFKLFRDQQELCLYSGTKLDAERLFEPGYVDIDHIIPYSISFDDSYTNKVLVLSSENRQKGNHLPLEYMADDPVKADRFTVLTETVIKNYRKRQKLLKKKMSEEELASFKSRNLVDTQYIARTVYNMLRDHLEFAPSDRKKKVVAVNGAVTDYIRKRLGLRKVREDGDLHHAMDAAVIATTTDGLIHRISNYAKRRERGQKIAGKYVDFETGELMSQAAFDEKYAPDFPEPWPRFRQELEARLSPDPKAEILHLRLPNYDTDEDIRPVFVSKMPNRKVSGAAHKETIRSGKVPGCSIVKTPLTSLKLDKNGEIKDYYDPGSDRLLYDALKAQLQAYGGKGDKAFSQPFHKPKHDGTPGPIVNKVKTISKSTLSVPVCGGIADNGGMVRIDVFHIENDGYYFVPVYTADTVKKELPNLAVSRGHGGWKPMHDEDFVFSLYAGDLIKVTSTKEITLTAVSNKCTGEPTLSRKEWLLYYVGAGISTASITATTHDRRYLISSLGIKSLISIEKYEVDILGGCHKVKSPEKRQSFR